MTFMSVGGFDVCAATLVMPRVGAWHLDAVVDSDGAPLSGAVTINIADSTLTLSGTVLRSDTYLAMVRARIVGGAGGLSTIAQPKYYQQAGRYKPTVQLVLGDLLKGAGETLSGTADAPTLATPLLAWTTLGVPTFMMLDALMRAAPANTVWRVLPDGTHWIGPETWPTAQLEYDFVEYVPEENKFELAPTAPTLLPGVTLDGVKVGSCEHHITGSSVRTTVWKAA